MSNPKVFEFAKEVGMTPLALMDKIREWQLPVKSHMAELEPSVLAQIKHKLAGGTDEKPVEEAKPKKVAAKKPVAKKVVAEEKPADVDSSSPKATVVRRKKSASDEPVKAKVISRPNGEGDDEAAPVVEAAPVKTAAKAVVKTVEKPVVKAEPVKEAAVESPTVEAKAPVAPVKKVVAPAAPIKEESAAPVAAAPVAPAPQAPARKKEVSVGTSGVSSNAAPAPRRNIVGRMDLSRVAPPPQQGGYQRGERSDRPYGDRPQGDRPQGDRPFQPRPGGFNRQAGGPGGAPQGDRPFQPRPGGGFNRPPGGAAGPNRSIRPGFVAATPPPMPDPMSHGRDFDKKKTKFNTPAGAGPGGAPTAKELEEVQQFNAVEFRKREMVFQPKKKKGFLERAAMKTQITERSAHKRVLKVNGSMKLSDAAVEMGIKAPQLIKVLMKNGVMANMNTSLDFDTIALIVPEFNWEAQNTFKTADEVATEVAFGDLTAELVDRPPVVTVMGHVDHGKTSLLDAIRNANVASGEAGGITQHIGAYAVRMEDGSFITFLDTPGHEAFTAMRARGANATDVAVIVVAADDGMMPQTQEAISHAKAAGVPIIVAVNKIDKPGADPQKIKQQLTEMEIVPEEWGGSTIFVEVSALKRTGIKELLENIRLVSEMQDLKANPHRSGTGLVIEAKLEKGKGPVATLLVKDGTVKVGQYIVAGTVKGRVRSLMNERGERVQEVGPGFPVEVLGLESTPGAGDKFDVVKDEGAAEKLTETRQDQAKAAAATPATKMSLEDIFSKVKAGDVKELAIILKADVHGSLEAINGMLSKLSTSEVKAKVIHSAVGGITESDVLLAQTAKAIIIGFNVRPDGGASSKAKQTGVDIRSYSIVYELVDEMKKAMGGLLTPDVVEEVMGRVEVRNTFSVPKVGTIAGCFVIEGKVQRNNMLRLVRDGKIVYEGKISSLKRFKDDAKEVATGYECGIGIENFNDIKAGDVIEAFVKKEIQRGLDGKPVEAE